MAQAAVEQQIQLRDAYKGFAKVMSATAAATNATWPFFTLHAFESIAANVLKQSGTEVFAVANLVPHANRSAWEQYATANHEHSTQEGHLIKYGNLDRLNPVGYVDFVSAIGASGFQPDQERIDYFPGTLSVVFEAIPLTQNTTQYGAIRLLHSLTGSRTGTWDRKMIFE